ncbi:NAD(+) synthase [Dehalococcoidia bacterium]|nr:NAD(+) synthase [Dehalococcoidia bacterium]
MTDDILALDTESEISRIGSFIRGQAGDQRRLVIGISGGIDSGVVARLCVGTLGVNRVRFFTVLQSDMEDCHIRNARQLAEDLAAPLVELDLAEFTRQLLTVLESAEPKEKFSANSLLDVGKAKNSLRTWIHSMYAERGYIVVGCSNRTEIETGFYLPFGDGISHIMPIAHLYKTQVRLLAQALGTRPEVIQQPASAGYWKGETDLEDLAFWMFHGAPVLEELCLSESELAIVSEIHDQLSFEVIDRGLYYIGLGRDVQTVAQESGLSLDNGERLMQLVHSVPLVKGRPLRVHLPAS